MLNLGGPEVLVILVVALVVLGPSRLPEVARQLGRAMQEIRKVSDGFRNEVRDAIEPIQSAVAPVQKFAKTPLAIPPPPPPSDASAAPPADEPSSQTASSDEESTEITGDSAESTS